MIDREAFVSRLILQADTELERGAVYWLQVDGIELARHGNPAGYSDPVVCRDYKGTELVSVSVDWTRKGYRNQTIVADELIDQWAADLNELEVLRAKVAELENTIEEMERYGAQGEYR